MNYANGTSPIIKERTAIHLLKGCVESYKLSSDKVIDYTKATSLGFCLGISLSEANEIVMEVINSGKTSEETIAEFNSPIRKLKQDTLEDFNVQRKQLRAE